MISGGIETKIESKWEYYENKSEKKLHRRNITSCTVWLLCANCTLDLVWTWNTRNCDDCFVDSCAFEICKDKANICQYFAGLYFSWHTSCSMWNWNFSSKNKTISCGRFEVNAGNGNCFNGGYCIHKKTNR